MNESKQPMNEWANEWMNKILQLFNTDQWIAAGDIQSELSCIFDWLVKWWNPAKKKKKCPSTGSRLSGSRWKRNVETLPNNFLLVLTICVTVSSIRVLVIQLNQFKPLAFNKSLKKYKVNWFEYCRVYRFHRPSEMIVVDKMRPKAEDRINFPMCCSYWVLVSSGFFIIGPQVIRRNDSGR